MDAKQIYSIVKDVPREAWPKWIDYGHGQWCWIGSPVSFEHANIETLFVGSMTLYLLAEGYHTFIWDTDSDAETVVLDLYDQLYRGQSELEALAAACKGVV